MSAAVGPAPQGFEVRVHVPVETVAVLRPEGALDLRSSPELVARVELHLQLGRNVVVDMRDVELLGTSALHALLGVHAAARRAGLALWLTGADAPSVARTLGATGLAEVLPVSTSSTEELVWALAHPQRPSI
jgi:anti-anti-sigma factor